MDAEHAGGGRSRLLESVPSPDGEVAAEISAACPMVDVVAGEPYFRSSLRRGALLIVERGFVVLRVAPPRTNRSIITCDARPGRAVLPPAPEEVLFALVDSKLTVISPEALDALLTLPIVAKALLEQLAVTLAQKQEAIGTFGSTSASVASCCSSRATTGVSRSTECGSTSPSATLCWPTWSARRARQ